ncbi:MAG: beta-propeller fold lactonase family protein [Phycisphaerales bacterium]
MCTPRLHQAAIVVGVGMLATHALAQADFRAVYVANDGNLEGSVSCFRVELDGSVTLVDRVVTGSRPNTTIDEPGCNPVAISISPSGRFLLTSHAAGGPDSQITVIEVSHDGTLTVIRELDVPSTPLDCTWITDTLLAATRTNLGGSNELIVYSFNTEDATLVETDRGSCGDFTSSIAAHPNGMWIYGGDSSTRAVYAFSVAPDGSVTPIASYATGSTYPLGVRITPDGRYLYGAGGISSGGHAITGFVINQSTGELTPATGSPYVSPGSSPARMTFSTDSRVLYMGHGTDATCRSFLIDDKTGALTSTGFSFDVGLQGTLGGLAALPGMLFITDESTAIDGIRGLYSFSTNVDTGAFNAITPSPIDSEGITPESVAVWDPACSPADLAPPYGQLDFSDVVDFLTAFAGGGPAADIASPYKQLDFSDVVEFLTAFGAGCP